MFVHHIIYIRVYFEHTHTHTYKARIHNMYLLYTALEKLLPQ